jgi:hypothetical protein
LHSSYRFLRTQYDSPGRLLDDIRGRAFALYRFSIVFIVFLQYAYAAPGKPFACATWHPASRKKVKKKHPLDRAG